MNTQPQENCAGVPVQKAAQQAQEACPVYWACAEAVVWTKRMLKALATEPEEPSEARQPAAGSPEGESEAKQNKWFRLTDKVWAVPTLQRAWERVKSNAGAPGVDGMTVDRFDKESASRLLAVNEQLRTGRYEPKPVKRVWIEPERSGDRLPQAAPQG